MASIASKDILDKIWKTEFDKIFLQRLDGVLEDYDKGKDISFNRLGSNRATIRGFQKGSRLHVAASFIAQRGGCTSSETPLSSDATRFQSLIQELLVETWARHNGCWVGCTDSYLRELYGEIIGSGSESCVYLSPNGENVIKEWKTYKYESIQLALDRITIHNTIFPETAMRVKGFGRNSVGDFVMILEQRFIQIDAGLVNDEEVVSFMRDIGFDEVRGFGSFSTGEVHSEFANKDFYVADLHKENIVRYTDEFGVPFFFVVDCAAYYNTPGLQLGGTFDFGVPEQWAHKSENAWPYPIEIIDNPLDYL